MSKWNRWARMVHDVFQYHSVFQWIRKSGEATQGVSRCAFSLPSREWRRAAHGLQLTVCRSHSSSPAPLLPASSSSLKLVNIKPKTFKGRLNELLKSCFLWVNDAWTDIIKLYSQHVFKSLYLREQSLPNNWAQSSHLITCVVFGGEFPVTWSVKLRQIREINFQKGELMDSKASIQSSTKDD